MTEIAVMFFRKGHRREPFVFVEFHEFELAGREDGYGRIRDLDRWHEMGAAANRLGYEIGWMHVDSSDELAGLWALKEAMKEIDDRKLLRWERT